MLMLNFLYLIGIFVTSGVIIVIILIGPSFLKYYAKKLILRKNYPKIHPEINFLEKAPTITGVLDRDLEYLPIRKFNLRFKIPIFNNSVKTSYRMAYGADFLYLYIETATDEFICRDRGYQHGDGFHMLLGTPQPENNLTDQFYVLGFSPQVNPNFAWAKKLIWYKDVDVSLTPLGDDVKFKVKAHEGKVGYELLLPWKAVYPYHPWISESIGFNLAFVKAIGKSRMNYDIVFWDWRFQAEGKKRKCARITFQTPKAYKGQYVYLITNGNCKLNEYLPVKVTTLSSHASEANCLFQIKSTEGDVIENLESSFDVPMGLSSKELTLDTSGLKAGSYNLEWKAVTNTGEIKITVLPDFYQESLMLRLEAVKDKITGGSFMSIQFKVDEIQRELKKLRVYNTASKMQKDISEILPLIQNAERFKDLLSSKEGQFRRAFRSKIDNSLQPYTIKVPSKFDRTKKYPLIIFLHGSGRDDRALGHHPYIKDNEYIVIAPSGRGISHYYCPERAQIDIQEAIDDVIDNYPVDIENIILTGFSMGGYGVYRTYAEIPDRYKALAIFSGLPKLSFLHKLFIRGKSPNFLQKKQLKKFQDVSMFIFHCKNDRNCPFELTQKVVDRMRSLDCRVEFHVETEGHGTPPESIIEKYNNWLESTIWD